MEQKIIQAFKELGTFLGKKMDSVVDSVRSTPQKIQIDMSETSKKVDEASTKLSDDISNLIVTIKGMSEEINKSNIILASNMSDFGEEFSKKEFNIEIEKTIPVLEEIKGIVNSISKKENKESLSTINRSLKEISNVISSVRDSIEPVDISSINKNLNELTKKVDLKVKDYSPSYKKIEDLVRELVNLTSELKNMEKIKVPDVFKLEDSQFRALRGMVRGSGVGGQLTATKITQYNLALTTANTEYSYTFPANTLSWMVKLRDQGTLLLYSFQTGTLPTSGDGSNYSTAPQNFLRSISGVEWSGKTIYVQTDVNSMTLEIEAYTI